jgi:hypothetical protein
MVNPIREIDRQAFTISEFCGRNHVSVSTYHKLKNKGHGPREMLLGGAIRITAQAERDWQQAREMPPDSETRLIVRERKAKARKAARVALASPAHNSKRGNASSKAGR